MFKTLAAIALVAVAALAFGGYRLAQQDASCGPATDRASEAVADLQACANVPGCQAPFSEVKRARRLIKAAQMVCPKE